MKGKRLRVRAARLLAVVYVMYVVMSGMMIPGTDGSIKPLVRTKAAGVSVTVANKTALKDANAGEVFVDVSADNKTAMFTIDKTGSTNASSSVSRFDIYSVKYNNQDYYYDPANKGDGSKAGLFYSDALNQWGFVFPQALTGSASIEVQVAMYLSSIPQKLSIYRENFEPMAGVGGYEQLPDNVLSELNSKLRVEYYDYNAKYNSTSGTIAPSTSENVFNTSNLRFYCVAAENNNHYTYRVQYGKHDFIYSNDIERPFILHVWKTEKPTVSAYREKGTNQLVVDTNILNAEKYLQVCIYQAGGTINTSESNSYPAKNDEGLAYNNGKISGQPIITFEDETFYLPLCVDATNDYYSMSCYYAAANATDGYCERPYNTSVTTKAGKATGRKDFTIYGPKSSDLGTLKIGTSANITKNLYGKDDEPADYAGNIRYVTPEGGSSEEVTEKIPYSDDYVTIDYYGNVTANKASGTQRKYTLTTETKYTKMKKGSNTFLYATSTGSTSTSPTGVYGTQTWSVDLTVTTTASSVTTETSTTEPTTTKPATYKATLSTTNSQTKLASGSQTATGDKGSISLEAGQTVTVTPGASTYGSIVKVDGTEISKNNGTYTFTMPAKEVTVEVTDITLSSISATITGTGTTASQAYAFGSRTTAPTKTEVLDAFKKSNFSITANLSNSTTSPVDSSKATYSVKSNTIGTATGSGDTLAYPGTAVITVTSKEDNKISTEVTYHYTYTTTNQQTLKSITITAKQNSALSTSQNSPTVYGAKSEIPSEEMIKNQIKITATYKDSLEHTSEQTIDSTDSDVKWEVTSPKEVSVTTANGVYTHIYKSQVTVTYGGKKSDNTVTFYYCYKNYSVTCKTVDETGKETNIPSTLKAEVTPKTTDIEKGTTVTIKTKEDENLLYYRTNISVKGASTDYTVTGNNNDKNTFTFTMPAESVTVTVTYTKLSDYTVTAPSTTTLKAAPTQQALSSLLGGGTLTPKYKTANGDKIALTDALVTATLGATTKTSQNGVDTFKAPVTIEFNGIKKENAFYFIWEEKISFKATVTQATGQPKVQIKKNGSSVNETSGYYGDTITITVSKETEKYAFPTVTVTSKSGKVIKTITEAGEATFSMPAEDVTIAANYLEISKLTVTPPDISGKTFSKDTNEEDLPLGTIVAEYGNSNNQIKEIEMTHEMYTKGNPKETVTENPDGGKIVTANVPVKIHVVYGEITKDVTFSYTYSYTVSASSRTIELAEVYCGDINNTLDNPEELVTISQRIADDNNTITITAMETAEYAFPSFTVRHVGGVTEKYTPTGDKKTISVGVNGYDIEIAVEYLPLTSIELDAPENQQYEHYTEPDGLDLTDITLTAIYGDDTDANKTIPLQTQAGVSNGCTITCDKGTAAEEAGKRIVTVTVTVAYGGKTASYQYTYEELRAYSVTLNGVPDDFANKEDVRLSKTGGNYDDELTLFLPADTDDMYAYPTVTVKCGDKEETWEAVDGAYETTIKGDMVVTVSYCKLSKLELTLPETSVYVGISLPPVSSLNINKIKLEQIYTNAEGDVGGRKTVPVSGNISLAYGKDTESVTDGRATHTVPVLVTANYNDITAEGEYSVWYYNYVVSVTDMDGNELTVDKNRANAGDFVTISLTPGMSVQGITADNGSVGYELSEDMTKAVITLEDAMRSEDDGYVFVVYYQTVQAVKAPATTAVVSDKIMTEEELADFEKKLADLSTFDFGTASILVSYDELEPNTEIELNSPSVTKELLADKTTEKESADGTYIERTYVIKATINGKSAEIPIIVKVEKKKEVVGDEDSEGPKQPEGTTTETGNPNENDDSEDDDDKPVTTSSKPTKVTGTKVAAQKRKLTVTWKAVDNATAYEIWVSTKENSGYLKAATVKKSGSKKTYSYTVSKLDGSKLKKGKTYYVKVRAVNVKSKLTTKTINQTAKSKKNRRLYVTVKSVKNAVSYTVKASTKKKGGYKTLFKFDEIGKKKYTKYVKKQKRNTKYYIKVEVKVETGKRLEGSYSSVTKVKCK